MCDRTSRSEPIILSVNLPLSTHTLVACSIFTACIFSLREKNVSTLFGFAFLHANQSIWRWCALAWRNCFTRLLISQYVIDIYFTLRLTLNLWVCVSVSFSVLSIATICVQLLSFAPHTTSFRTHTCIIIMSRMGWMACQMNNTAHACNCRHVNT